MTGDAEASPATGATQPGKRAPVFVAPLIAATAVLAACLPPGGATRGTDAAQTADQEADRPILVVRNDSDRPVTVRLLSGGAQVARLWVAGLARDTIRFRRTLVSVRSRLRAILEEGGSDRVERLDPIALPTDARAAIVVVRSLLDLSYISIR